MLYYNITVLEATELLFDNYYYYTVLEATALLFEHHLQWNFPKKGHFGTRAFVPCREVGLCMYVQYIL